MDGHQPECGFLFGEHEFHRSEFELRYCLCKRAGYGKPAAYSLDLHRKHGRYL